MRLCAIYNIIYTNLIRKFRSHPSPQVKFRNYFRIIAHLYAEHWVDNGTVLANRCQPHRHLLSLRLSISNPIRQNTNDPLEREVHAIRERNPADDLVNEIESGVRGRWRRSIPIKSSESVKIPPSATTATTSTEWTNSTVAKKTVVFSVLGVLPAEGSPSRAAFFSQERPGTSSRVNGSDRRGS